MAIIKVDKHGQGLFSRLILAAVVLVSGCSTTPANWARKFDETANCGMSVTDIEAITGKNVVARDNPGSIKGTHYVGTDHDRTFMFLWLGEDRSLQAYEIYKIVKLKEVSMYIKKSLC